MQKNNMAVFAITHHNILTKSIKPVIPQTHMKRSLISNLSNLNIWLIYEGSKKGGEN